jgi:hypothetical protein
MNRYEVDFNSFSNTVYYIFDNYTQDYLNTPYEDFDIADEDCDILNQGNQIELATY